MIVLRTPEGWTGPNDVDGRPADGTCAEATAHEQPRSERRFLSLEARLL
jgi:phosphoketolase